ncbi:LamG-like jellyroll fold domain-containing protein [Actinocrispum sp. NPDC049592]|uniref:LamG-like jellyroll fold domain-containing protein n=1 Tax=Actinocrispum sp. NPDC049592 TaxID=3154835 RepID=UPI003432CD88
MSDRVNTPAIDGHEPAKPGVLKDVPLRPEGMAKPGFDAKASVEDPAQRDANAQVFRNPDGTFTRRLFDRPVNARRPDGSWTPVDLGLSTGADGRSAPKSGPYPVSFGAQADHEVQSVNVDAAHGLSLGLRGASRITARRSDNQITYPQVLPDTDLTLRATATGTKEDIVLHSAGAPTVFDFDLSTNGLVPSVDTATGDVRFAGSDGVVRAAMPAGWMQDAHGAESRDVSYQVTQAKDQWTLRVSVDPAWLRAKDRAFPVVVDPSIQINTDLDDTYVTSGSAANRSGDIQLKIGKEGSAGISAAYLHFPGLASQLRNQYINGAALVMYNVDSASCTPAPVDVFAVGAQWTGSTLTTWPGAPLGQHLTQKSFAHGKPGCAAAYEAFGLPADVVTDWTHGSPFYGLSVRAADEGNSNGFKRFASADAGGNSVPYLDVTYTPQGASYYVNEVTLPTNTANGRIQATVTNRGSATWTPGGPHRFGFIVKQGNTVRQVSPKFDVPRNVEPNGSVVMDVPMGPLTPGDYQVFLTMYDGNSDYQPTYGVPYGAFAMKVENVPPSVNVEQPGSGASVDSLTPTLYAEGVDTDNWPNQGLRYNFRLCDGPSDAPVNCVESGWTNATWTPPVGRLRWSTTYYWWVRAHDTVNAGPFAGPLALTTQVPQPEITSHLGGTPQGAAAPGLDPQVGNFGIADTDADVPTVGPDLTITRGYNSLDPRTSNAFGQGWVSRLDTELREDADGSGNVVVTLPSGRQMRFGRNSDGGYAPPAGQNLTLVLDTSTGYYTLRDVTGGSWQFNPWGRLRTITDPSGLVEELEYDVAGPGGTPRSLLNRTSGRRLFLTWTGGHITSVQTDPPMAGAPALRWDYSYDGHKLASVCDPGPAPNCTRYNYQAGSHYRSVVLDDNPRVYYRFGESNGGLGANSATARTPDADRGTYTGVALGGQGALTGTVDGSAAFDGQASRIDLPAKLTSPTMSLSMELWFRTTAGGVLASYADKPFGTASNQWNPVLYVGQDGYLRGGFSVPQPSGPRQISSQNRVNDGQWHHVVLSAAINTQTLYLDGTAQPDKITGVIDHDEMTNLVVGTGKTVGWASGNNGDYYFAGSIDELAIYRHPLGAPAVVAHYTARQQVDVLTKVTLPQNDRVAATLTYDNINDRVATYTDHDGREWRLENPVRNEATRKVTLHGPYPDWSYEYDADHGGRLTASTHDEKTRRYGYNTAGFLSDETDEIGHKSTFTTDARGNVLSRSTCRAPGSCHTAYSSYFLNAANPLDPRNDRKLSDSDARSIAQDDPTYRTTYTYDTLGRLTATTYPRPTGAAANPTETWRYSTGTESADGGGTVPAGLLTEHTGKRAGQTTRNMYRANGDLAETTAPTGLRTRWDYDGIGRRTAEKVMSATGAVFNTTTTTYTARSQVDTETGSTVTNSLSGSAHRLTTKYGYDANGNTTQTTLTDTAGADPPRTTTLEYNEHDQLVTTIRPDGGRETREYRNAGQETRVTDPKGTTWTDITDSRGRLLRRVANGPGVDPQDPSSTVLVLEIRNYDAAGRLAATRDAMGRETQYTYYDDDLLATVTRSGVLTEQREYDPAGNVVKLTGAGGRVVASTVDAAGYPGAVTVDPAGLKRTTSYQRDPDGLVRTENHTGAADPNRTESISYGYDANGALLRADIALTPGDLLSDTYIRDERGLVIEQANRRRMTTNYTYDGYGHLLTETGPEQETWVGGQRQTNVRPVSSFGYNTFGERTHFRDPNGALATTGYDAAGRATSSQLPDYTPPGGAVIRATAHVEYDTLGNPTAITDPLGRITRRDYDPYGRVRSETLPKVGASPSTTTIGYDRAGEVLSVTDPTGATRLSTYDDLGRKITDSAVERQPQTTYFITKYGYDDADNLTSVTTPGGAETRATYNAAGQPLTSTDPTGRTTSYDYDIVGRQASVTDPAGLTTRTGYDLLGRPVTTTQSTGNPPVEQRRWQRTYDPADNLLDATSPEGRVAAFRYDPANRVVRQDETVDTSTTIHTTFGYDAAGNRTQFIDGNNHPTVYTYTPWGLPESTIEPGGATWTAAYDAAGQSIRTTAPGGVIVTADYDDQGRMTAQHGSGAEAPTADKTFGYDPAGHVTSFGTPTGPTALTHDDRGNLLTIRGPSGDATFTYSADSRVATRADTSGTATFTYDLAGRPLSIADGLSGRTVDYTYNTAGQLTYTAEHGAERYVKRLYTYDPLGRLTSDKVTEFDPTGPWTRTALGTEYGYDRDDNVTSKTTIADNRPTANTYSYDGANRLTSWTAPTGTTGYQWDNAGNRTRAGSQTFTYNDRNQLVTDGATQYTYTPRGTLATAGTRVPSFDAFDQMVKDGNTYTYDSLGRVAQRGATSFNYGSLDNDVVSDGSRLISRGLAGDPLSDKAIGSTGTAKLLYADQHGDVVGTFRGSSTYAQRTYDPFGAVTSSSGDQPSVGYQGEWTEPSTGAVNMHARWYTPATGNFTSRDTWTLAPTPSTAANRYTYGGANPLGNTDPTGHLNCGAPKGSRSLVLEVTCTTGRIATKLGVRGTIIGSAIMFLNGDDTLARGCADQMQLPDGTLCPMAIQYDLRQQAKKDRVFAALLVSSELDLKRNPHRSSDNGGSPGGGGLPGGDGSPNGDGCPRCGQPPHGVTPPPPPPPLWLLNIERATPRPDPGVNTTPRPDTVVSTDTGTTIDDPTSHYADNATQTTDSDPLFDNTTTQLPGSDTSWLPTGNTSLDDSCHSGGQLRPDGTRQLSIWTCGGGADLPTSCTNSFIAGTPVLMADGTTKPIDQLKVGDEVTASDLTAGKTEGRDVTNVRSHESKRTLVEITVQSDTGTGTVVATDEHPFWDATDKRWSKAIDLKPGHKLQTADHRDATVTATRSWSEVRRVYNLTVDTDHTYYVVAGTVPVLTHNYPVTGVGCNDEPDFGSLIPIRQLATVGNAAGNTDYRQTFYNANPGTQGNVWVHHAIEQQVLRRYPGLFSPDEIHSLENLRGIPKGAVNSRVHLSAIRNLWNTFYASNPAPSRQDVLDYATDVDDQLGQWFMPRIR